MVFFSLHNSHSSCKSLVFSMCCLSVDAMRFQPWNTHRRCSPNFVRFHRPGSRGRKLRIRPMVLKLSFSLHPCSRQMTGAGPRKCPIMLSSAAALTTWLVRCLLELPIQSHNVDFIKRDSWNEAKRTWCALHLQRILSVLFLQQKKTMILSVPHGIADSSHGGHCFDFPDLLVGKVLSLS
ncbi:hypothetical protein BJX63DRAFT_230090 [Aspergillus granulosus]|uniref:Secreted protein n=1 Tax=Aspergillus granulosus TaxID=176169 RepID=A0ABR4HEV7_9EURO